MYEGFSGEEGPLEPKTFDALLDVGEEYLASLVVKAFKRGRRRKADSYKLNKADVIYFIKDD